MLSIYLGPWWNTPSSPSLGFGYYNLLSTEKRPLNDRMGSLLKPKRQLHISVFPLFLSGEVPFILFPAELPLTKSHRATQRRQTTPVTVPCTGPFSSTARRTFCHWHRASHFVFCSRKTPAGQHLGGGIRFALSSQLPLRSRGSAPHLPAAKGHGVKWTTA